MQGESNGSMSTGIAREKPESGDDGLRPVSRVKMHRL